MKFKTVNHTLTNDNETVSQWICSLAGLSVGDTLGSDLEFRLHAYAVDHLVTDMQSDGTQGLRAGPCTDDTSMALFIPCSSTNDQA